MGDGFLLCLKCGCEAGEKYTICPACLLYLEERRKKREEIYALLCVFSLLHPVLSLWFAAYHISFNRKRYAIKHFYLAIPALFVYIALLLIFGGVT